MSLEAFTAVAAVALTFFAVVACYAFIDTRREPPTQEGERPGSEFRGLIDRCTIQPPSGASWKDDEALCMSCGARVPMALAVEAAGRCPSCGRRRLGLVEAPPIAHFRPGAAGSLEPTETTGRGHRSTH